MNNISDIINIFNAKSIRKICKINDIITILDANKFSLYFKNLKNFLSAQIFNSNTIVLNNTNNLNKKEFLNIKKEIKQINQTANLIEYIPSLNIKEITQKEFREIENEHNFFIVKTLLYMGLLILLFTYLITLSMSDLSIYDEYLAKFQKFYAVFISILIQGLPFILMGSFVSSIVQIYISKNTFIKLFSKNTFLSCIIAAFAGILFPICDCGTIPVVKSLIKKKVPMAAGITFMLAAPIINPIAIISTIYAFQNMKTVVFFRVAAGLVIAISVGLTMQLFTKKDEEILIDNNDLNSCQCSCCNPEQYQSKNNFQKIKSVFIHTGDEFFNTGKFMIIGTFLSSVFQSAVSLDNNMRLTTDNIKALIFMILLSFLLSVCSTSDAFIAKGFLRQFSINSVMGFLVVGPMIDVKNTIMLFGNFKTKFALKLIFFIIIISFLVLINLKLT